jgi:hypothetical protein
MARPRLEKDKKSAEINIYLRLDQLEWLKRKAHAERKSPSAMFREWVEQQRKLEEPNRYILGPFPCRYVF